MADNKRFLIIALDNEHYGIPIIRLLEIMVARAIQKDPKQTGVVEGKIDFRGAWIPVLNIKKLFKISGSPGTTLLVLKNKKGTLGILVDAVMDIMDTDQKTLPLPKGTVGPDVRCYSGVIRYKEHLALLLNEDGLLP